jgi:N-carbamoylputrescine amidase
LVAEMGRDDEGVISAAFDLDFLAGHRAAWGFFRDRRPDLYGALAAGRPA